VSGIDIAVVDSLKVLDPKWPIREADIALRWTGATREAIAINPEHMAR
jgi:hypothetical protein